MEFLDLPPEIYILIAEKLPTKNILNLLEVSININEAIPLNLIKKIKLEYFHDKIAPTIENIKKDNDFLYKIVTEQLPWTFENPGQAYRLLIARRILQTSSGVGGMAFSA